MTTKLKNHKNTIINYYPGARGDFLASCLCNLDLNLTKHSRTILPVSFYKIRGIEKSFTSTADRDSSNQYYNSILNESTPFIQSSHFINRMHHEDLDKLTSKYKIYQIQVESDFYRLIFLFVFVKNHLSKIKTKEELEHALSIQHDHQKLFLDRIEEYCKLGHENITSLYFKKIFYPPYEDYIRLYQEINESDPDISLFEQRLRKSELPKTIELFDTVLEIDVENYTIKKL